LQQRPDQWGDVILVGKVSLKLLQRRSLLSVDHDAGNRKDLEFLKHLINGIAGNDILDVHVQRIELVVYGTLEFLGWLGLGVIVIDAQGDSDNLVWKFLLQLQKVR
jgi:hypothetical protein